MTWSEELAEQLDFYWREHLWPRLAGLTDDVVATEELDEALTEFAALTPDTLAGVAANEAGTGDDDDAAGDEAGPEDEEGP